jgi:hypothetical protein
MPVSTRSSCNSINVRTKELGESNIGRVYSTTAFWSQNWYYSAFENIVRRVMQPSASQVDTSTSVRHRIPSAYHGEDNGVVRRRKKLPGHDHGVIGISRMISP